MKNKLISVGVPAVLIILGGLVLLTSPLWAVHQASWAPSQLTQEVMAGDSITVPVSLTAERSALPNTVVEVSPGLAGIITVTPSEPGTIPRGKSVVLNVTVSPPRTAVQGTIEGTLRLHKKTESEEMLPPPLPVRVVIRWPTSSNQGVTVTYPPTWTLDQRALDLAGPISLRNFPQYSHGGIRPRGGADINITRTLMPLTPLSEVIAGDLVGAVVDSTSTEEVAGVSATRVTYHDDYTPGSQERGVVVYVPFGNFLYKFFLGYDLGDPNESSVLGTLDNILNSTTLTAN